MRSGRAGLGTKGDGWGRCEAEWMYEGRLCTPTVTEGREILVEHKAHASLERS